MQNCETLRRHAKSRKIAFGINHEMHDFRNGRKKDLDLVLCAPSSGITARSSSFFDLCSQYGLLLTAEERERLVALPVLVAGAVGSVYLALEAKACMTAHQRALPRLYGELNSSHLTVHGDTDSAIAACFVMVNAASSFVSPDLNKGSGPTVVSAAKQPTSTVITMDKVKQLPRRSATGQTGYDAIGIVVIEARNDGGAIKLVADTPAPPAGDIYSYSTMIDRLSSIYSARFGAI
jgi:hypothetical protein